MKLFILALIAGSMLAVSPSAAGQHYDDTIHNNISIAMRKTEVDGDSFSTNPIIAPLAKNQIMKLAAKHMPAVDLDAAKETFLKTIDLAKKSESHTTFHAFVANMSFSTEEARTYELTVIRNEHSMVGVLSTKTHIVDNQGKNSFYSEIYSSEFGLPFNFTQKSETHLDKELISYMRQYLLRSAEQVRKSSMHNEHQLQNFAGWANQASVYINAVCAVA
jgi:hypothetical protein